MGEQTDEEVNQMLIDSDTPDGGTVEDELQVPPSPRYYCGIGRFRPKCLQVFASKKFFTFILCVYCLIEGAVSTGECIHPARDRRRDLAGGCAVNRYVQRALKKPS